MKTVYSTAWYTPLLLMALGSVAILSAVYRLLITITAIRSGVLPTDPGDAPYVEYPVLSIFHLVAGLVFCLLGPFQFSSSLRGWRPKFHRVSGRVFVISGVLAGVTGIIANEVFPTVGNSLKENAVYAMGGSLLLSLYLAMKAILRSDVVRHRAWMTRAFAAGISVATQRLIFIPLYLLFGLPSDLMIGLGMWAGLLVNLAVAEWILRRHPVA